MAAGLRVAQRRTDLATPNRSAIGADALVATALTAGTLVLRLLFAAKRPTDWDSAQFVAGASHFDVSHGSPHPPGYYLYVEVGHLIHVVTGLSTVDSLVLLAALASALASGVLYMAARELLSQWLSVAAVGILATSPVTWFNGSIVNTYSFDELAGSTMLLLALRARRGTSHGAWALLLLGVFGGFRPSVLETTALIALIPVVVSVRSLTAAARAVGAGVVGLVVWVLPVSAVQPGGLSAWYKAAHLETIGAYHTGSIFYANHGGGTRNLREMATYTVILLAVPAALWLIGLFGLVVSRRPYRDWWPARPDLQRWQRPLVLFVVGVLPAILVYAYFLFGKGGYALAYAPAATVLLLYPLSVVPDRRRVFVALGAAASILAVGFNVQRFTAGYAIIPQSWGVGGGAYDETAATIRAADQIDLQFQRLAPYVNVGDLLVIGMDDPVWVHYRDAGWALPASRIFVVNQNGFVYGEQRGTLYYLRGTALPVGPGQDVVIVSSTPTAALQAAKQSGIVTSRPAPTTGNLTLWRLAPGATYLGIRAVPSKTPPVLNGDIATSGTLTPNS